DLLKRSANAAGVPVRIGPLHGLDDHAARLDRLARLRVLDGERMDDDLTARIAQAVHLPQLAVGVDVLLGDLALLREPVDLVPRHPALYSPALRVGHPLVEAVGERLLKLALRLGRRLTPLDWQLAARRALDGVRERDDSAHPSLKVAQDHGRRVRAVLAE